MTYSKGKVTKGNRRDWVIIGLLWALALMTGMASYEYLLFWADGNRVNRTVYAVCEYTRQSPESEQSCAVAQNTSHTEYMCDENNNLASNHCWVEVK